ncbi:putative proactivator polypeptide-like 1 [Cocos nucifera]|uniref:Putative proactivator polypeptide-like 1 n=1 Tax=Cocos nucifera TaxID=13894 RepID=A0A8K0IQK6_COCNU|nr:putative proactivator polypeptide-like 1 [Cocos nucifera]
METRMAWCLAILFISLINVDARRKVEPVSVNEETLGKAAKISSTMKLLEEIGMVSSEVCHILPADLEAKCLETSRTYLHQTKLLFQGPSHEESHCNNTELCTDEDRSLIGIDIFIEEKILMKCKETVYKYAPQVLSKLEKTKPSDLCRRMSMCVEEINM